MAGRIGMAGSPLPAASDSQTGAHGVARPTLNGPQRRIYSGSGIIYSLYHYRVVIRFSWLDPKLHFNELFSPGPASET